MREEQIHAVVKIIKTTIRQWEEPVVGVVARESHDPFRILIACLLSLRTKDQTTAEASQRLHQPECANCTPTDRTGHLPCRVL